LRIEAIILSLVHFCLPVVGDTYIRAQEQEDRDRLNYCLLWLRTFDRFIAIRIQIQSVGDGILTAKVLRAVGGFEPGAIEAPEMTSVSASGVSAFLSRLENADLWEPRGPLAAVDLTVRKGYCGVCPTACITLLIVGLPETSVTVMLA
jgi:hypothetical protein